MITGLSLSVPNFLIPNVFPAKEDERLPFSRRYVTKAYLWIAIFNFIGNYFWTHYFFVCLGARYTFPITITLNGVPVPLFLITQSYFTTYFVISNIVLRFFKNLRVSIFGYALVVGLMSWFFAFMETWTIQSVFFFSPRCFHIIVFSLW
eukprot:TRINITY_DN7534_c0_g1_i2.p1 TRINITY_DN7534_c0_g1~~TRINITY_DN7534_c0_g1_i2.p1  ORF type:complete len:149 (+),score=4.36 TRINITY_DN7534_c0_g1_i2:80-526(+)